MEIFSVSSSSHPSEELADTCHTRPTITSSKMALVCQSTLGRFLEGILSSPFEMGQRQVGPKSRLCCMGSECCRSLVILIWPGWGNPQWLETDEDYTQIQIHDCMSAFTQENKFYLVPESYVTGCAARIFRSPDARSESSILCAYDTIQVDVLSISKRSATKINAISLSGTYANAVKFSTSGCRPLFRVPCCSCQDGPDAACAKCDQAYVEPWRIGMPVSVLPCGLCMQSKCMQSKRLLSSLKNRKSGDWKDGLISWMCCC